MSQSDAISVTRTETGYVVSVHGQGTRNQSPAVRDFISGAMEDKASVVLDLSLCVCGGSTFLGRLMILHKRGCQHERFSVHADDAVSKKLLHPTRLDTILPRCEDLPKTVGPAVPLPIIDLERDEFGRHLIDTHEELAEVDSPTSGAFRMVCDQLRKELGEM